MIRFDHVSKIYPGGTRAVEDFSLTVEQGSTTVFLGTSGCGKTTLMRMERSQITSRRSHAWRARARPSPASARLSSWRWWASMMRWRSATPLSCRVGSVSA